MKRAALIATICAFAFQPGEVPHEIQLWNAGDNPTDYGVHRWTERSSREVLATYRARGNPLQIDVEHNYADDPTDPGPTGGYARLELRGGEPWLVFDWSAYAVQQIETKQRRFLSPEYDVDKVTGEIVRLVRVSLVADPGTHHARMLARIAASAARRVRTTQGEPEMNLALILAALKAANAADDPEAARAQIASLIAEIETLSGGESAPSETPPGDAAAAASADGDAPSAADDDEEKKRAAAAASDEPPARTAASAAPARKPAPAAGVAPSVDMTMATRLAALEADALERKITARVEVLPESLRAFARTLNDEQFATYMKQPEVVKAVKAHAQAGGRVLGVRASSTRTQGEMTGARPGGELDSETKRHLARVFGNDDRPAEAVQILEDGRVRASHLARPARASSPGAQAPKG